MPKGENPNSKLNLMKGNRFNSESGRIAQKKSVEAHSYNSRFREAGKEALTDDELRMMFDAMIKRAKNGNVSAFKALFDVMGESQQPPVEDMPIRLAFIAEMDPPEQPPEDIEEESII